MRGVSDGLLLEVMRFRNRADCGFVHGRTFGRLVRVRRKVVGGLLRLRTHVRRCVESSGHYDFNAVSTDYHSHAHTVTSVRAMSIRRAMSSPSHERPSSAIDDIHPTSHRSLLTPILEKPLHTSKHSSQSICRFIHRSCQRYCHDNTLYIEVCPLPVFRSSRTARKS